jgi:DNA-binding CsgD family transcriptional regulator
MEPIRPRADTSGLGRTAAALGAMVDHIGRPGFADSVGALLVSAAPLEQCILFLFGQAGDARCLYAWHRTQPRDTVRLAQSYLDDGHYRRDPLLARLPPTPDGPHLGFLRREHIDDAWYRGHFFDAVALGGKMAVFDGSVYLNFYSAAGEELSDRAVDHLAGLSGVVCRSIARHLDLTAATGAGGGRVGFLARLLARRAPQLTERERAVCARVVAGFTGEAIALDLGIAASSVATYRKRAYAKLGICSQHELFSLCLDAAAGED